MPNHSTNKGAGWGGRATDIELVWNHKQNLPWHLDESILTDSWARGKKFSSFSHFNQLMLGEKTKVKGKAANVNKDSFTGRKGRD